MKRYRKHRKEVIKLGKLEGSDYDHLRWESKDRTISWNFAYCMPMLLRDILRDFASNVQSCPDWLAKEFDYNIDDACAEWSKRINQIADKFDYASKIDDTMDFLSEEDQAKMHEYLSQGTHTLCQKDKNDFEEWLATPTPEHIKDIQKKEDKIAEDMRNKLKEALQELGEIWYDLWD